MPQGDKDKYTDKQKRQAEHIEEGYEERGVSEEEAEKRAWATVNKTHGGGNKPGGSGAVAYSYLSRKKGDPHVIATATGSYITTPVHGQSPVSYKDFTNVAVLCVEDYIGVVRADSPYKSLKELIAAG